MAACFPYRPWAGVRGGPCPVEIHCVRLQSAAAKPELVHVTRQAVRFGCLGQHGEFRSEATDATSVRLLKQCLKNFGRKFLLYNYDIYCALRSYLHLLECVESAALANWYV